MSHPPLETRSSGSPQRNFAEGHTKGRQVRQVGVAKLRQERNPKPLKPPNFVRTLQCFPEAVPTGPALELSPLLGLLVTSCTYLCDAFEILPVGRQEQRLRTPARLLGSAGRSPLQQCWSGTQPCSTLSLGVSTELHRSLQTFQNPSLFFS